MYPTVSDIIKDLIGINIPLPIQTFGFFVALAFIAAAYTLAMELKRKEEQGLLHSEKKRVKIGGPATSSQLLFNAILGFIIGWKGIPMVMDYDAFVANPQDFILSSSGSIPGGFIIGLLMAGYKYWEKKRKQLPKPKWETIDLHPYQLVGDITIVTMVTSLIGAKLFHNLENPGEFAADPVDALISFSGLSFYGGLVFGAAGVLYYAHKKNIGKLYLVDAAAPGLMLAYGIGRIGCQLAGDGDWGIPNDAPMPEWLSFLPEWVWAYDYPNNVLGINLKEDFIYMGYESITGNAWPTPLYEAVASIALFFVLWGIRKKITVPGILFSIYLIMNGVERFFIEKIRINPKYDLFGLQITQAEIISFCLVILGIAGIWYLNRHHKAASSGEAASQA